jgi:hypothetical protein
MNTLLASIVLVLMTGCSTVVPVKEEWPTAPQELLTPASNLTPMSVDKTELSDLLENANNNFTQYYLLKDRFTAWQKWYTDQQKIYESK